MSTAAQAFFLPTLRGERYCLYHPPAQPSRGALVYIHPFAEEMNKSRRMAAMQARAFSALGIAVLQIDLEGCGDSDGDFADASWEHWKADIDAARGWLAHESGIEPGLWGLRLGALLALDYAASASLPVPHLLLWQPVLDGATFLHRFLRLQMAADMHSNAEHHPPTKRWRERLLAGEPLDIAGYRLSASLGLRIDGLSAATMPPTCPTVWIDISSASNSDESRIPGAWHAVACHVTLHHVSGPAFWKTQEITECTALIMSSCDLLTEVMHA